MADDLLSRFDERSDEISVYLDFLDGVETLVKSGVPRLGADGPTITTQQQRILYSSVYLQLYNLVEATIVGSLDAVSKAAMERASYVPADLSDDMRREWVRYLARTNVEMGPDKRLERAIALCDHLVAALPVKAFDIDKGGGGNWHEGEIRKIADRIGCTLRLSRKATEGISRPIRNELGAMGLVVSLRNALAHGNISFVECGQYDTAADLRILVESVRTYLREVVAAFGSYIEERWYLRPERRSAAAGGEG
ncbi:MAG TPA: MAE_28990/MAE_18760 family HEPN-like nuclease [Allosphingosinicella sp.]|jgi:hypothetical protein